MNVSTLRTRVLEEIRLIPENKLPDLYDFIRYFRLSLEASKGNGKQIMQFAGCWQDMPDEIFTELSAELAERRRRTFPQRQTSIEP
jgi:hypothetical protein